MASLFVAVLPEADASAKTRATIAVAANFLEPAQSLATRLESETDYRYTFVSGSTGQLAVQVLRGAPYDLFLAADETRPRTLALRLKTKPPFAYARGVLVLWNRLPNCREGSLADILTDSNLRRLAIADPALSPYGKASDEVLERLKVTDQLETRRVNGFSVAQVFSHAATGNAQAALIAKSQVAKAAAIRGSDCFYELDTDLYEPILQFGLILPNGLENPAIS
ncbi:MAG: molybdate ABC transporter substrate-binding protein, partial [Pseudomonadota bacterium]